MSNQPENNEFEIADPSYEKPGRKKTHKIVDGNNIRRILPPCGPLAKTREYSKFEAVHWGTETSAGPRPYRCIQRKKGQMITQRCGKCEVMEEKQEKLKELVDKQKKSGTYNTKAGEKERAPYEDWLKIHNLDKKHWINTINEDGEIGRDGIGSRFKKSLEKLINDLRGKNSTVLPCSINGFWVNFERSGSFKAGDLAHVCSPVMDEQADGSMKRRNHTLTPDILERMKKEAWDLSDMYKTLTEKEIDELVANPNDKSVADRIFGINQAENEADDSDNSSSPDEEDTTSKLLANQEVQEMLQKASKTKSVKEMLAEE